MASTGLEGLSISMDTTPADSNTTTPHHIVFDIPWWEVVGLLLIGAFATMIIILFVILLRKRMKKRKKPGERSMSARFQPQEFEMQERPLPASPNQYESNAEEIYDNRAVANYTENANGMYSEARKSAASSSEGSPIAGRVRTRYDVTSESRDPRVVSKAAKHSAMGQEDSGLVMYEAMPDDGVSDRGATAAAENDQVQYEDVSLSVTATSRIPSAVSDVLPPERAPQVEYEEISGTEDTEQQQQTSTEDLHGTQYFSSEAKTRKDSSVSLQSNKDSSIAPLSPTSSNGMPLRNRLMSMERTSFDQIPVPNQTKLFQPRSTRVCGIGLETCSIIPEMPVTNTDILVENTTYVPFEENSQENKNIRESRDIRPQRTDSCDEQESNMDATCDNVVENTTYVPFEAEQDSKTINATEQVSDIWDSVVENTTYVPFEAGQDSKTLIEEQAGDSEVAMSENPQLEMETRVAEDHALVTANDVIFSKNNGEEECDQSKKHIDNLSGDKDIGETENDSSPAVQGDPRQKSWRCSDIPQRISTPNIYVPIESMMNRGGLPTTPTTEACATVLNTALDAPEGSVEVNTHPSIQGEPTDVSPWVPTYITRPESRNVSMYGHTLDDPVYCAGVFMDAPPNDSHSDSEGVIISGGLDNGYDDPSDIYVCGETQFMVTTHV